MKLSKPVCPTCGERAVGTVERLYAIAKFNAEADENGLCDWSGSSRVIYDAMETETGEQGGKLVQCGNGHEWETEIGEDDDTFDDEAVASEPTEAACSSCRELGWNGEGHAQGCRWHGIDGAAKGVQA